MEFSDGRFGLISVKGILIKLNLTISAIPMRINDDNDKAHETIILTEFEAQ